MRFVDASDEVLERLADLIEDRGLPPNSIEPLPVMPSYDSKLSMRT